MQRGRREAVPSQGAAAIAIDHEEKGDQGQSRVSRKDVRLTRVSSRPQHKALSVLTSSPPSHLTMATAVTTTHTSAFSFTAPFSSSSGPKQRRVSLATPASEREVPAFKFRDDTSLPSPSEERRGKVRRLTSPAPQEKKARKKWTMEETQMLVEGCNRVSALPSLSSSYCGVTRAHRPLPFPL